MRVVEIEKKDIYGISTRTTNQNEMNPTTAKIGSIWQEFGTKVSVDYQGGEKVFGVYYDYESDANGEFNVLAGCEKVNDILDTVTIKKGRYLVFHKRFEATDEDTRIQAVIETWGEVWAYFSDEGSEYQRVYATDFEFYKNQHEIEIYISIKSSS